MGIFLSALSHNSSGFFELLSALAYTPGRQRFLPLSPYFEGLATDQIYQNIVAIPHGLSILCCWPLSNYFYFSCLLPFQFLLRDN